MNKTDRQQSIEKSHINEKTQNLRGKKKMYSHDEVRKLVELQEDNNEIYFSVKKRRIYVAAYNKLSIYKIKIFKYVLVREYDYSNDDVDIKNIDKLIFYKNNSNSKHFKFCNNIYVRTREEHAKNVCLSTCSSSEVYEELFDEYTDITFEYLFNVDDQKVHELNKYLDDVLANYDNEISKKLFELVRSDCLIFNEYFKLRSDHKDIVV